MVAKPQAVKHEQIEVGQQGIGLRRNIRDVCAVRQAGVLIFDAKAQDGESAVHQPQGRPGGPEELEGFAGGYWVRQQAGDKAFVDVGVRLEDVAKHALQRVNGVRLRIDRQGLVHDRVETPQIVGSKDVVGVRVGVYHRVEPGKAVSQRLGTKVRPGVD